MSKWILVHLIWSLSAPPDAAPTKNVWPGFPTRADCEFARIYWMAKAEPKARRQTAQCIKEQAI